jgi:hypothetical protein
MRSIIIFLFLALAYAAGCQLQPDKEGECPKCIEAKTKYTTSGLCAQNGSKIIYQYWGDNLVYFIKTPDGKRVDSKWNEFTNATHQCLDTLPP